MELRQLRYFVAVARTLNFTEAARQLYITQGTLSQQLRQLEYELGSDLFVRTSHSVMLTEAGEALLPLARQMLETSALCQSKMEDLRSKLSGVLRVGVSNSFKKLVASVVKQFLTMYPDVTVQIHCRSAVDLLTMLRDNELDLIVTFRQQEPDDDLFTLELFETRLSAVMRREHHLASRSSLRLEDMEKYGLIMPGNGLQTRRIFEEFFDVGTGRMKLRATVNDVDMILSLLRGTDNIALLSSLDVLERPDFVAVPVEIGTESEPMHRQMMCCAQRLAGAYRKRTTLAFVDLLSQQAAIERICMSVG